MRARGHTRRAALTVAGDCATCAQLNRAEVWELLSNPAFLAALADPAFITALKDPKFLEQLQNPQFLAMLLDPAIQACTCCASTPPTASTSNRASRRDPRCLRAISWSQE